ncbi:MAG: quinone-dependent dihydroorotate dehydrogenase [Nanoarchaeota archaeon]|nr:quinone-dependent dihydroorotate dehydrogenase [Nanoarchaeota archaeon]MBU1632142.1 quinone-dependent dihydroorotate dehydrogenase [Nanoarchaeota archaeon]MBU1876343.1 quinone-dependent dihydroorotate dehydrogenase [Nanoarchaeota archaeon]
MIKIYQKLIRPVFFKIDPERVHNMILFYGKLLGKFYLTKNILRFMFNYQNDKLKQKIHGIEFSNPIGLAAGFDKDAQLMNILPSIGFGYEEIGTITAKSCTGNPKPRLWRMPKYKSIVVNYGLKNLGCKAIAKRLKGRQFDFPLGINIAKTNSKETVDREAGIKDYVDGFSMMEPFADYITINISCPNAYGGQPFSDSESLNGLLHKIDEIKISKPIFLKLSPDLPIEEVDKIIAVCDRHNIQGFVISNLVKNRSKTYIPAKEFSKIGEGGLSGKVVYDFSNELISHVYKKTKGRYIIIGCGGIFTAEDAYEKIKRGASLLQLITGLIYEGPGVIKEINKGIVELLEKDGFTNISEAVGSEYS